MHLNWIFLDICTGEQDKNTKQKTHFCSAHMLLHQKTDLWTSHMTSRPLHTQHLLRLKQKNYKILCFSATAHCGWTDEVCAAGSAWGRRSWSWCRRRWALWPSSCSGPCRGRGSRPPPSRSHAWCPRCCRRCVRWRRPSACVCAPRPAGTRPTDRSILRTHRTPDARTSTAESGPCALEQRCKPLFTFNTIKAILTAISEEIIPGIQLTKG